MKLNTPTQFNASADQLAAFLGYAEEFGHPIPAVPDISEDSYKVDARADAAFDAAGQFDRRLDQCRSARMDGAEVSAMRSHAEAMRSLGRALRTRAATLAAIETMAALELLERAMALSASMARSMMERADDRAAMDDRAAAHTCGGPSIGGPEFAHLESIPCAACDAAAASAADDGAAMARTSSPPTWAYSMQWDDGAGDAGTFECDAPHRDAAADQLAADHPDACITDLQTDNPAER